MTPDASTQNGATFIARATGFRTAPRLGRTRSAVTFDWKEPGLLCLRGPNGSGKTTLLAALARGRARPGVEHLDWHDSWRSENNTYLPTTTVISPRLRPLDYLRVVAPGLSSSVDGEQLVPADRSFKRMSRGEVRRWEVALTCRSRAGCLFLDEPERSIDRQSETWIASMLSAAVEDGKLVVVSSHSESIANLATLVVDL